MKNKAIERLEERQTGLTPGTLRHEALERAKQFKTSWIELGRVLWTISKEKAYRGWGYLSFEAYCAKEVGIRGATAKKLLHSYYFLEKEEPVVLRRLSEETPARLPAMDSVNALRIFRGKGEEAPQRYEQVREQVLEKGAEPQQVRREIRLLQERMKPTQPPGEARADRREKMLRRAIGTLRAMRLELETDHLIPERLAEQIELLAGRLETELKRG